jgi:orotate phosphoribosyltransferase
MSAAEAARTAARILLEIEAVHFRPRQPFTLTSGRASPVYIDCRKIISFPRARTKIIDLAVELIEREIGFNADAVAGGETAGIPFAAWIADRLLRCSMCARSRRASAAAPDRGAMKPAAAACWSRTSRPTAVAGQLRQRHPRGRGPGEGRLRRLPLRHLPAERGHPAKLGVRLHGLATWRDMLAVAEATGLLSTADAKDVRAFLDDPEGWSTSHGGKVVA